MCSCVFRFVEYGEYKGHLYGTSTDAIDEVLKRGRMCIIDVEPHVSLMREPVIADMLVVFRHTFILWQYDCETDIKFHSM